MPAYQTQWNRTKTTSNAGSPYIDEYIESLDKKGKRYLKKTGQKNVYEAIQENAKGCDIYDIIDKYLETGDETLLNKRKGVFGNFVNIPKNPMEVHNMIIEAESQFEQLDKNIRNEFENDVNVFKQSILDGSFEDRVAHYIGEQTKAEKAEALKAQIENNNKGETKSE